MSKSLAPLSGARPNNGCDPEFFFMKDGKIIGAEKVLPKAGFKTMYGQIIIDGVQGELNPQHFGCREGGAGYIRQMFIELDKHLKANHPGVSVCFDQTVPVTQEELNSLAPNNKVFGCDASFNAYNAMSGLADVDASKFLTRSAGGHIHLGVDMLHFKKIPGGPDNLVKLMDIIVGNTCVLIDRDPGNRERRKLYGMAGEYRLPKHGLEYRTLSNFWLLSNPLMSLAFGLVRTAYSAATSPHAKQIFEAFFEAVSEEDIRQAINTNNYHLALKNFNKIKPLLLQITHGTSTGSYPLNETTMKEFLYFAEHVKENGMDYWFNKDTTIERWKNDHGHLGAQYFFTGKLRNEMNANPIITPKVKTPKVKVVKKESAVKRSKAVKVKKASLIKRVVGSKTAKRSTKIDRLDLRSRA